MNSKTRLKIYEAIDEVIYGNYDIEYDVKYLHSNLITQMTNAAVQVFDSAQQAQQHYGELHGLFLSPKLEIFKFTKKQKK